MEYNCREPAAYKIFQLSKISIKPFKNYYTIILSLILFCDKNHFIIIIKWFLSKKIINDNLKNPYTTEEIVMLTEKYLTQLKDHSNNWHLIFRITV